jgi:hypothetical protein
MQVIYRCTYLIRSWSSLRYVENLDLSHNELSVDVTLQAYRSRVTQPLESVQQQF